ncbi:MAG: recombinase family protein [Actinomycetota bacterium]
MAKKRTAAIYCRISHAKPGDNGELTTLGVDRQEADCRALAKRSGWTVREVFLDNDKSAFGRKPRPHYRRMIEALRSGEVDAILAWHPDRLYRRYDDLAEFVEVVKNAGAEVRTVQSGEIDLSTATGRWMAQMLGSAAVYESDHKSERIRRKHQELAEDGKVSGGGLRPFGFELDRKTIRRSEAREIVKGAARLLAGESVRSITRDWNARGVPTVRGGEWAPTTVKRLFRSGRISGQREHHGRIVGPAEWPAIIEPADTLRLRAILDDPSRMKGGGATTRSYLLTGWVVCGRCEAKMTARPVLRKGNHYRRYVCSADRGGCGRCGIGAQPLEDLISEAVFSALDTPKLAKAVAKRRNASRSADPLDDVTRLEARLDELAEMFAAGEINRSEWSTARAGIERRLTDARAKVAIVVVHEISDEYLGRSDVLRAEWEGMTLDRKRAVISTLVNRVLIAPTTRANNRFDRQRVDIEWQS